MTSTRSRSSSTLSFCHCCVCLSSLLELDGYKYNRGSFGALLSCDRRNGLEVSWKEMGNNTD